MHIISIADRRDREYRFECSCGTVGNWYGNSDTARSTGYSHKVSAEGNPNRDRGLGTSADDNKIGY